MSNADRVRSSTADSVQQRLDEERLQRVTELADAPAEVITQHIKDLDRAWDVERVLEALRGDFAYLNFQGMDAASAAAAALKAAEEQQPF
ncbi:hypothetical protein H5392_02815 [Tessaracoccus sp. MC1865]|uniref:hypothetical protein n=1 Tax=Tessaracoccus sp. MC1865 TaxID=2760310 RepID=UPI0016024E11|nr:hypothetical protein [Tessaracoccus sp. MC1865]MBB1482793.1 hypothetical protein [Tessaracoccus sp. MC1865]QTO37762.1 hypothetical protein J7D54_01275 [Tessaracoccus sp. MC1865]